MHGRFVVRALTLPAGVLIGHGVGYLAAHPAAHDRTEALAGHGYLDHASAVAVPLALAGLALSFLIGVRRPATEPVTFRVLAVQQVVAFVALEIVEHAASGAGAAAALGEPGLWWGIGAQVVVAMLAVAVLSRLHRAGQALTARAPTPERRPRPPLAPTQRAHTPLALTPISRRGPPALLVR